MSSITCQKINYSMYSGRIMSAGLMVPTPNKKMKNYLIWWLIRPVKLKKKKHTHTQYPCTHYSWNVTQNTHVLIIHEMFHPFPLKDNFFFIFFFKESFNLWCPLLMIILYNQTKTPIDFSIDRDWTSNLLFNHKNFY